MLNNMSKQKPNDQKSDANNPNNPAFKAAQDNRSVQLNPNNLATKPETHPVKTERQQK
jgi:hypothetical protein